MSEKNPRVIKPRDVLAGPFAKSPGSAQRFALTDSGNGERMVDLYGDSFRHVEKWGEFLVWDGSRWDASAQSAIRQITKKTARAIYREAAETEDDDRRRELVKWAARSESRDRRLAMEWAAASEIGVPVKLEELNRDPFLLNVRNGTIDLLTGELRRHRREDLITSLAPVAFDRHASCPTWLAVLGRIFAGNGEVIKFVQRLCGSVLTGDVSDQVLPILHGGGANGKSTLIGVLLELLGPDYAYKAPANLLMVKRGESHPTELASLYGKRLAVCVETGKGARINESLVKELTGSDPVTARRMRENFWTFAPTHKVWLVTNHKPVVAGTDNAIWRRLTLLPFDVSIPKAEQDRALPGKLRGELPGILAWAVRGCLEWRQSGLNPPVEVTNATAEYKSNEDVLGGFLAEHCVVNSELSAKSSQLFFQYLAFMEGSGEKFLNRREFGEALVERGFERYTSNGTRYRGLGLRSDGSEENERSY